MPNNASEINAKKVISRVALESVVFYRQNKNSHQFNDLLCCQRVNCSFWMQKKFTGSQIF